ncbi:hypothetical protein [Flammeovirga sp. SJP92]|uniref:hypothetical protein n=1 Tax=Flammeovirga sp. SJP92 TaxID=1775430 RepID=UPI0007897098|nr:hypothetical protein [Flammeovirga sp. SJP92]KXX72767.1 hypothetical protein AVL50_32215 [Flammeovirga sp. SJP92]
MNIDLRKVPADIKKIYQQALKDDDNISLKIIEQEIKKHYPKAIKKSVSKTASPRKKTAVRKKVTIQENKKSVGSLGAIRIDKTRPSTTLIQLPTIVGDFLENVERKEYALVLRGQKGAGKSTLLFQIMNAFGIAGYSVCFFSLEMAGDSKLISNMRDKHISAHAQRNTYIVSDTPNGIKDLEEAARKFDVVAIDSFSKVKGAKQGDFDYLRKKYPNTFFIVIFQSTTAGTARGGSMSEYDAQCVIQCNYPGIAHCEKNRYSEGEKIYYDIHNKKIVDEEK